MKEFAKKFYNSAAWRKCRAAFIMYRYGLCERCSNPGDIVHHTILLSPENINDPEISLNFEHLELLCATCHQHEHMSGEATQEGLAFNSEGGLIER